MEEKMGGREEVRERLSSRIGFILLSAGCAIGIGNVWRFPFITGQSGGGWFVLLYLAFLALLGVPVLVMEFAAGRAAQRSIATLHGVLTPGRRGWALHGVLGSVGLLTLMMYYTTVTGWMGLYFFKTACGASTDFTAMLANPVEQLVAMVLVCEIGFGVCACGLVRGLERVTKFMMLALLALIVILALHSLTLEGAMAGVRFYLVPDFARMKSVGIATVVMNAMNQSFFTLSLGIGSMAIFGSYIGKQRTLLGEAVHVTALDTFVALMAGLIVIPACFAFGIASDQGPGLIFVTLPKVFARMTGGRVWGALFFVFMTFAALSTVLAVFEGIIASLREYTGWGRGRACAVLAIAVPLLSAPCAFGGKVLVVEDFIVSNLLLPIGALLFAIYCVWHFGWGWDRFLDEANTGVGPKIPAWLRPYCAYVLPLVILTVLVMGLK